MLKYNLFDLIKFLLDHYFQKTNDHKESVNSSHTRINESNVRLTGWDAMKFGASETEIFDCTILDVPSSNEKKVFNDEKEMKKWTDKVST